jgi:hypothetical protein
MLSFDFGRAGQVVMALVALGGGAVDTLSPLTKRSASNCKTSKPKLTTATES